VKPVLVTGATGFLGLHLLPLLLRRGETVRVLTRARPLELDGLDVEVVEGSILDEAAVARAVRGVDRVYHLAGLVSRDPDVGPQMYRVHVDGTRHLLSAAAEAGVRRVVVSSTSGTIAVSEREEVSDETAPYRLELVRRWPYYLSKIFQEKLALSWSGPPEVVVMNPTILLGPGDVRGSSTGDVLHFLEKEVPVLPSGGLSFVDARDAAAGAILAMERGAPGQRYLMGGPNWTVEEFFARLSRVSGVRAPSAKIPGWAARLGAHALDRAVRLGGSDRRAAVDPVSVEMSQVFWWLDAARARTELGWEPRDPMETLEDTVAWLRERHLGGEPVPRRAPSLLERQLLRREDPAPSEPEPRRRQRRARG
jgi:dihydroflavonol-4-reductase